MMSRLGESEHLVVIRSRIAGNGFIAFLGIPRSISQMEIPDKPPLLAIPIR